MSSKRVKLAELANKISSSNHKTAEIATVGSTPEVPVPETPTTLPPLPSELEARGAEATIEELTRLAGTSPVGKSAPPTPTPPTPAAPARIVGRRTSYDLDSVIVVTPRANGNPKRPNTAGWARFAVYAPGMTVGEYIKHPRVGGYGRDDIRWDLDRGFIRLVSAAEWQETVARTGEEQPAAPETAEPSADAADAADAAADPEQHAA